MDPHAEPGPVAQGYADRRRAFEETWLSPLAARSWPAGRAREEPDCGLRTPLQRDRDRIVHCKAFRRLKHKTQVFVAPEGDHYRTRLTHTLEVTQISRTVARALDLNEDLSDAGSDDMHMYTSDFDVDKGGGGRDGLVLKLTGL